MRSSLGAAPPSKRNPGFSSDDRLTRRQPGPIDTLSAPHGPQIPPPNHNGTL